MSVTVNLYSLDNSEIKKFLDKFYNDNINLESNLEWKKDFENPIELADIIGTFIDNNDKYRINMWISLDEDFLLNVTEENSDKIIRYLFERYPY